MNPIGSEIPQTGVITTETPYHAQVRSKHPEAES